MSQAKPPAEAHSLLDSTDHSRDSAGMTYVYPVVSRRAAGVSIGINLNPNNACNWRCVYCQVPDLQRGNAPPIDLARLEEELGAMLRELQHGDFMSRRVPVDSRRIADIAFSGNGEPTSATEFPGAVDTVIRCMAAGGLAGSVKLRLITNGSMIDRPQVRSGLSRMGQVGGEVWFKVDTGERRRIQAINGVDLDPRGIVRRLQDCSGLCSTWVQTCCFALDGFAPNETELVAWLDVLGQAAKNLSGVHLYGLARPSMQSESQRLARLAPEWFEAVADRVRKLGLQVQISP